MLLPSPPPRCPQATIVSSSPTDGLKAQASIVQVGFGPTRVGSASRNALPTVVTCSMKELPLKWIPLVPLPFAGATSGTAAPPPRASKKPPIVPAFGVEGNGPTLREVASMLTSRLLAVWIWACAPPINPAAARATVNSGNLLEGLEI